MELWNGIIYRELKITYLNLGEVRVSHRDVRRIVFLLTLSVVK